MCNFDNCENKIKKKYGNYCFKHRREYLVSDNMILYDLFTFKSSDYLKKDIINTLKILFDDNIWLKLGKNDLFNILKDYYSKDKDIIIPSVVKFTRNFITNENLIFLKKIQNKRIDNRINNLRGVGFKYRSKCNNDTDFFTYDNIDEIDNKYFFSYKDNNGFIWFFDIRSFNKLIKICQNNPYTREEIPISTIEKAKILSKILKLDEEEYLNNKNLILNRRQLIKQNTIDIFSQMEQYGFSCNIEWFLELNSRELKKLYKNLEDIWNYRLNLSYEIRSQISPPNGMVFNIPVSEVYRITCKEELKEIILKEISKFNNAVNDEFKKLGFMYFLLGLGLVSRECYESHQWIIHAIY